MAIVLLGELCLYASSNQSLDACAKDVSTAASTAATGGVPFTTLSELCTVQQCAAVSSACSSARVATQSSDQCSARQSSHACRPQH